MKYQISTLVYGFPFVRCFSEHFIRSFNDETNGGWLKKNHETTMFIFTDEETCGALNNTPGMKELEQFVDLTIVIAEKKWDPGHRYQALAQVTRHSVNEAAKSGAIMSQFSADAVFAKGFFEKLFSALGEHDAVFGLPIRGAYESMQPYLTQIQGAPTVQQLFEIGYHNLHHLWTSSNWEARQFSRIPYTFNWDTETGLIVRTFSVSPLLFKPLEELVKSGSLDLDAPAMFKNPKWLQNWTDAPIAGAEFLGSHYPSHTHQRADANKIGKEFARRHIHPTQIENIRIPFFYPDKETAGRPLLIANSETVAEDIIVSYKT